MTPPLPRALNITRTHAGMCFDLVLPSGVILRRCFAERGSTGHGRVHPPRAVMLDKLGNGLRDETGRLCFEPAIGFCTTEARQHSEQAARSALAASAELEENTA